jgi:hypothetical protein
MLRERFAVLRGAVKVFPVESAKSRDLFSRKSSVPYSEVKQLSRPEFGVSGSSGSSGPVDNDVLLENFPEPLPVSELRVFKDSY